MWAMRRGRRRDVRAGPETRTRMMRRTTRRRTTRRHLRAVRVARWPVEMRRVGDTEWRVFKSRSDAGRAFSISSGDVSKLISPDYANFSLRESFEARNCAPPADAVYRTHACEARRVGDKKWRRFATRNDAAAAFPG